MQPVSITGTDAYAQSIAYDSASRMIELVRYRLAFAFVDYFLGNANCGSRCGRGPDPDPNAMYPGDWVFNNLQ